MLKKKRLIKLTILEVQEHCACVLGKALPCFFTVWQRSRNGNDGMQKKSSTWDFLDLQQPTLMRTNSLHKTNINLFCTWYLRILTTFQKISCLNILPPPIITTLETHLPSRELWRHIQTYPDYNKSGYDDRDVIFWVVLNPEWMCPYKQGYLNTENHVRGKREKAIYKTRNSHDNWS